jgi:aspartate aminotransferase
MPQLSAHSQGLPASSIRKLSGLAEDTKKRGIDVIHLNIGQPDIAAPKAALEAVENSTLDLLPYGPSQGTEELRTLFCAYYAQYQVAVAPEDILVTQGASEGIQFVCAVLCNPGDEIIVPDPSYANYYGFAAASHVTITPVLSTLQQGFQLPPIENIKAAFTQKTKAILICNPSNPTGYVYSKFEIEQLCALAYEQDCFLIVDEVYREFIYDASEHYSVLRDPKWAAHTIMLDSVSKRYSMCGARVGCIVSRNKEFMATALKFAHLRLSTPTYATLATAAALKAPQTYFDSILEEYQKRRAVLIEGLNRIPKIEFSQPKGAFYCMVALPVDDAEDFVRFLLTSFHLNNTTAMFAPAAGFYAQPAVGKNQIRIAFIQKEARLKQAIEILKKGLEAYCNS